MAKATAKKVVKRRRERKNVEKGAVHIRSSFNNTMVTITDLQGNALSWASSGGLGFRGSRKSTPYAAQMCAETAAKAAMEHEALQLQAIIATSITEMERNMHTPLIREQDIRYSITFYLLPSLPKIV